MEVHDNLAEEANVTELVLTELISHVQVCENKLKKIQLIEGFCLELGPLGNRVEQHVDQFII